MSNQEADEVALYIELLQERVRQLSAYVKEAAGDESCLLPVSTLSKLFYLTEEEREAVLYAVDHMIQSSGACRPGLEKVRVLESAQMRMRGAA
jgi:hypothetical protein